MLVAAVSRVTAAAKAKFRETTCLLGFEPLSPGRDPEVTPKERGSHKLD